MTLHGVSKRYEGATQAALDGIDLAVETGRITAIMDRPVAASPHC